MNYGQSAFAPLRFTTPTLDELAAKQWTGETGIWAELPVVKGGDHSSVFHTEFPQFSRFSFLPLSTYANRRANEI